MEIPPTKLNRLVGSSRGTAAERAISEILELAAGKNKHGKIPLVFENNLFPRPDDALRCFIAVREILAARGGVSAWERYGSSRWCRFEWVEMDARKRDLQVRQRSANVPIRMFFVFFVSRLVCSTATGEKVPDSNTTGWFGADGRGGSDLPRQSLFISL